MRFQGGAPFVERELPVVVGEGALSDDQITELHLLSITGAEPSHNGDARLILLQNA